MIAKTLQTKIGEAMKAHDETRTSTLRLLLSAFNYEQINKQHDLTEEEELAVIRREAKKRKEAVEMYKGAGADDRATKEEAELAILQEYLPPEMGEEELAKIIDEAFTQIKPAGLSDMGKVVGFVKGKAPNADGGKIAEIVKGKLS
ncbi:MAG: GatB/Yqey domain protein [Microgenomates group bacterium GW2011_GWC1_43_13]|uniref:GatB/Yqey domain protein n=1 Tax=Candidatus Woesebacteria bacterium GW2011_GWA1_44_23 TaxID=1618558 RepID=A0A837IBK4_9BACT|nr:MAG: GatB/Yqey domain protein [Microgenomates group bacterium GW2011_GWC1_43_13]KKT54361.1 MAG: GatB/Yqey domain protein [Candidatus Woesebacteria bacterium GW2011_GWA1_44_23]OGM76610.1 MAG: hypothetical protein A2208_01520 [Candidatus Woesebacteria bacterium RIFOXYA1_FULL_43_16]OGM82618.1 MAG: hypothetical protein A2394_00355 [Candidatus Woesebacteria bacterium RIFOXYB1_FULL_42_36]OGM84760.1 MAG: hypothetical protein A2421_00050 [Candidatus Woesebacteria bacterium RIFOXYC1_FULL_43_18]